MGGERKQDRARSHNRVPFASKTLQNKINCIYFFKD